MMNHDDANELLEIFALDALEDPERAELSDHLAICPRCRADLDGLRGVSAALGNIVEPAPAHVWDNIAARLYGDDKPELAVPPAPIARLGDAPARHRRATAWTSLAAAAAAAAVVAMATLGWNLHRADAHAQQLESALANASTNAVLSALDTPGHVDVQLKGEHARVAEFVVLPDGRGYLVNSNLAGLSRDDTYQLWAISGGKAISIGLMGPSPSSVTFTAAAHVSELAITVEPASGAVTPTTPIVASGVVAD